MIKRKQLAKASRLAALTQSASLLKKKNQVNNLPKEITSIPSEMVLLEPMGVTLGPDQIRPLLLMKMKDREAVLPVLLSPLEAGLAMSLQHPHQGPGNYFGQMILSNPHRAAELLLSQIGLNLLKAEFWEIKGPLQFVKITFELDHKTDSILVRADEAMSFGLHLKIPFYASLDFIQKSKALNVEVDKVSQTLLKRPELLQKTHPYLI